MLEINSIIRFTTLMLYVGMIASSITGFIEANNVSGHIYRVCLITTSLVIMIQNFVYLTIEMLRLYDKNQYIIINIYYIRCIIIIHTSILAIGISDLGLGFGIFGIVMFFINILAGVFIDTGTRYSHLQSVKDEGYENP